MHAANIVSLPSTTTVLLYKPWDVSAALSLLLARKLAVKFASDSHWTGSSALRSHLLAPFALRWIPAAATALSPRTRPRRTVFACEGALVKAPGLSRRRQRMLALPLFVRRASPPKSLLSKVSARSRAALRILQPRFHSLRTTMPTTASRSPRSSLLPKLDALILAARRPRVEGSPPKVGCLGSCCPGDKRVEDNDTKSIHADPCCSKVKPVVEPPTSGCAGSFCGTSKNTIIKELPNAASSGSCCKPPKQDTAKTPMASCGGSRCAEKQPGSHQGSCNDACCSSAVPDPGLEIEKASIQAITDIENQGTGKEHVVLSISGMTCTGCETKLNRTLVTLPAVKDLKTSLVLSLAEFNIDFRFGSVEEVMKHLERTTEFKCETVQNQGSSLDLIVPDEPSKFITQTWPDGVLDMAPVDKQIVRVAFDPKIVGARDLTEKICGPPIELAPPRGDPSLEAGSKHARHVGYMTLLSALLTIPVLVLAWASLPEREVAYSSASLTLATIVQVVIAGPFYPKALKAFIFSRVIEMDLLIVLSTSAAYIFSVVSFGYLTAEKPLSTGQFFETSTLLVTLIMVGRWFGLPLSLVRELLNPFLSGHFGHRRLSLSTKRAERNVRLTPDFFNTATPSKFSLTPQSRLTALSSMGRPRLTSLCSLVNLDRWRNTSNLW